MLLKTENKPIRVLQLFTTLNRGGAETMIMNYYRNIDRTKVQFDFTVHRQEKGAYEDEIDFLGGKIYRFLPFHPKNFIAYKRQISLFFDEHPEYQIIHGHVSHLGYFFYKEAKKRGIPCIIIHSHNTGMDIDIKAPFHVYFKYVSCKYPTHYFSCGQKASEWLFGKRHDKKVHILKNAIDTKTFFYDKNISYTVKKQINLENKFVIGNIARFSPQKNHSFLIDVFSEIYNKNKNSLLILVGDGQLRLQIEEKVKSLHLENAVLFLGIRQDISELMQVFDVFLFPSLYEGLPVTLVEAQATGLKCIISDRVPDDIVIAPDLVEFISLKRSSLYWAEKVLKYEEGYNRKNTYVEIKNSGYDILTNAKWLEQFYLDSITQK